MRRIATTVALIALLAFPAAASAEPPPYPGAPRNPEAVAGGPHCHSISGDTSKLAYPSHKAHLAQLAHGPAGAIFGAVAEVNC